MAKLSGAAVYRYALAGGFSPADAVIATQIAWAESGWDTTAVHTNSNGSKDYGLMQINDRANADILNGGSWSDPTANMRMAKAIKDRQGWGAWVGYTSGRYKQVTAVESHVGGTALSPGVGTVTFVPPGGSGTGTARQPTDPSVVIPAITNPLSAVTDFLGKLTNPGLWSRIGIGALGVLILVIGVIFLLSSGKGKVIQQVAPIAKGLAK